MTSKRRTPANTCAACGGTEMVPAIDRHGVSYLGCARCTITTPRPGFSLRKLFAVQQRVEQLRRDGSYVHLASGRGARQVGPAPFTDEQLAIIAWALGVVSAERLKAGDRLDDPELGGGT